MSAQVLDPAKLLEGMERLNRGLGQVRFSVGLSMIRWTNALVGRGERVSARRELAFGQREAERDPHVQAFCATTNEGRCRVVVRRLGGWS